MPGWKPRTPIHLDLTVAQACALFQAAFYVGWEFEQALPDRDGRSYGIYHEQLQPLQAAAAELWTKINRENEKLINRPKPAAQVRYEAAMARQGCA